MYRLRWTLSKTQSSADCKLTTACHAGRCRRRTCAAYATTEVPSLDISICQASCTIAQDDKLFGSNLLLYLSYP